MEDMPFRERVIPITATMSPIGLSRYIRHGLSKTNKYGRSRLTVALPNEITNMKPGLKQQDFHRKVTRNPPVAHQPAGQTFVSGTSRGSRALSPTRAEDVHGGGAH